MKPYSSSTNADHIIKIAAARQIDPPAQPRNLSDELQKPSPSRKAVDKDRCVCNRDAATVAKLSQFLTLSRPPPI